MKIESNKNWTTCLRLNTGDGSPRVFLLNSHFLGSVPCIQIGSLFKCLYSHKNYIQHKSISKIKILRPFGLYNSSNGKEQPMWNRGSMEFIPTPSLKLGSDWDSRLNPVPHYSYYKNVRSLFSHYNYTKSNRSSFVQMKKRDLRIL